MGGDRGAELVWSVEARGMMTPCERCTNSLGEASTSRHCAWTVLRIPKTRTTVIVDHKAKSRRPQ